jgi:penicillin-binding protein-related factor A (putative recombinase)
VSNSTSSLFVIAFNIDKARKALCFYVQEFSDINYIESVNKNKTICFRVSKSVEFNYVFIVCYNTGYSQIQSTNKLT